MNKSIYLIGCLIVFGLQILLLGEVLAQEPEISSDYTLVSKKRINRTVFEFTFKVTLINHDVAIKNISAVVTSTSPNTTIMAEGRVNFNDTGANETTMSTDTVVLRQDRSYPFNPDDLHWKINFRPDIPMFEGDVHINMIDMSHGAQMTVEDTRILTTAIHFMSSEEDIPYTVRISQTVTPQTGLTLSPLMDHAEFSYTHNIIDKQRQRVTATVPGEYVVTTIATIVATGDSSTHTANYTVLPSGAPNLIAPSPGYRQQHTRTQRYLRPDTLTSMAFSMSFSGKDYYNVTGIRVIGPELGLDLVLNDTGEGGDDVAGDRIYYSQWTDIDTHGVVVGECLSFHAVISTTKGEVTTSATKICVTGLPMGNYPVGEQNWVRTRKIPFARNIIYVTFSKETPESRMLEIAASIGGQIVAGSLTMDEQGIKDYDMTILLNDIPSENEALEVLLQKIRLLKSFSEVIDAGRALGLGHILSRYADDPIYQTLSLPALPEMAVTQARADEAWYVVRGNAAIAVLDTGIDAAHQDLAGKILAGGHNYAENNDDVEDQNHHGSHVAGIAAAVSNNGLGIAAAAWDSKILPFKLYEQDKGTGLKPEHLEKALIDLIDIKAIKIIDVSSGFSIPQLSDECLMEAAAFENTGEPLSVDCETQIDDKNKAVEGRDKVCAAVAALAAKDKMVIAAAGNAYTSDEVYPAACPDAIAVGGVEPGEFFDFTFDPVPWFGSVFPSPDFPFFTFFGTQHADWVDIAAPANLVVSTVPPESCFKDFIDGIVDVIQPCFDPVGGYQLLSGTSQAAPMVGGAAAVILARHPDYTLAQVKDRLEISAVAMPNQGLGAGSLNVFEAVFNGDFEQVKENAGDSPTEASQLEEWQRDGGSSDFNCNPFPYHFDYGILPAKGSSMLACHNGGTLDSVSSGIRNLIDIPEGVTELPLSFSWKVLSADLDTLSIYDDRVVIELIREDDKNKRTILFATSLNNIQNDNRALSPVPGLNGFLQTEWIHDSYSHPIEHGAGKYYFRIYVLDIWDSFGDTMFLVDDIHFRERFLEDFIN